MIDHSKRTIFQPNDQLMPMISFYDETEFKQWYNLDREAVLAHQRVLLEHAEHFRVAAIQIVGSVPADNVMIHSLSSWSRAEFPHFARRFHGDNADPIGYRQAKHHHIQQNPYRWEHWITHDRQGGIYHAMPMPQHCSDALISDWIAWGKLYRGTWDIGEWLVDHMGTIVLHPDTQHQINQRLNGIGYQDIVDALGHTWGSKVAS